MLSAVKFRKVIVPSTSNQSIQISNQYLSLQKPNPNNLAGRKLVLGARKSRDRGKWSQTKGCLYLTSNGNPVI